MLESLVATKNNELTEKAISMMQTSEILDQTHKELKEMKQMANQPTKMMISKIIFDLQSGQKHFNKKEFELLLKETYSDFYKKLLEKCPTLTRNEIRLCAFAKMNLSIKEIAALTQQSSNSIVVARYRLKKKLKLDEGENLDHFLISL